MWLWLYLKIFNFLRYQAMQTKKPSLEKNYSSFLLDDSLKSWFMQTINHLDYLKILFVFDIFQFEVHYQKEVQCGGNCSL